MSPNETSQHEMLSTIWATPIIFALVGACIGLRTVAVSTLPHILSPLAGIDYQNITDGLPVPRLLDWDQTQIDVLAQLRDFGGAALILGGLVLFGILGLAVLRTLNPRLRLYRITRAATPTLPDPESDDPIAESTPALPRSTSTVVTESVLPHAAVEHVTEEPGNRLHNSPEPRRASAVISVAFEPTEWIKACKILALLGLPLIACWLLSGRLDPPKRSFDPAQIDVGRWGLIWAVRMALLGAAVWLGFHPLGLCGNTNSRSLSVTRAEWPRLALTGATFGLSAFAIGHFAVPGALEPLLLRYQALGAFNVHYFRHVAYTYLFCMGSAWFAAGALFRTFASPNRLRGTHRVALMVASAAAVSSALVIQIPFQRAQLARRLDLTGGALAAIPAPYRPDRRGTGVPDGPAAARELARTIGLEPREQQADPPRPVLLFNDNSVLASGQPGTQSVVRSMIQNGVTEDGLRPSPASARLAANFLNARHYQSALSWVATEHRFDVSTYRFDTTGALTACLDDLRYGPHPVAYSPYYAEFGTPALQITQTIKALFFICAATPQNLAQLDRWADPDHFSFPDRQSTRLMGDLYRRFADIKHALEWYRRADMPRTFMARIRSEKPLFHTGNVTGMLRLNGRPLVGVQVGVVPSRLNGVPTDLEGFVRNAIYEIGADYAQAPGFESYHPVPSVFRWLSASTVTDSRGAFTLDSLTEGEYRLVCTLPSDVHLNPPADSKVRIVNAPLPFNLHYGTPNANLGMIDLFIK